MKEKKGVVQKKGYLKKLGKSSKKLKLTAKSTK